MDISLNRIAAQVASANAKKSPANPDGAGVVNQSSDEAVEVGSPKLQVNDLKAGAASASGIDEAKVARIANALQNGKYTIDPRNIAERMIASEFDLP
jgi:flagellar biosynthesis anti-sigma factor FlgM